MKLVLSLLPDGRGVLTTEDTLSQEAAQVIKDAWKLWAASDKGIAVISQCRVERVTEIELQLDGDRLDILAEDASEETGLCALCGTLSDAASHSQWASDWHPFARLP
jgi:hypothetical protein